MKQFSRTVLFVALIGWSSAAPAQDASPPPIPGMPPMPEPTKEHVWLQQFAGEWKSESELSMGPDQPPLKCQGTHSARMVGGFWLVEEGRGEIPGLGRVTTMLTIGFDSGKQEFVGTWIDSTNGFLWHYAGALDPTGRKLVLECEGPNPAKPGTTTRFRDEIEFTSQDQRVLRSSVLGDDGVWVEMLTAHYRRKS